MFSLKCEYLTNQINIMMNIIDEACTYIFLIMTDNLPVYQKMSLGFRKENPSTAIYSIKHPTNNSIFDTLSTLYDFPHCFKNRDN